MATMPKYPIGCEAKDTSVIYTRKGIKYGAIHIIAPYRVCDYEDQVFIIALLTKTLPLQQRGSDGSRGGILYGLTGQAYRLAT